MNSRCLLFKYWLDKQFEIKYYNNQNKYNNFLIQFGGAKRKIKWKTLEHNGVMFPPNYEPHHIPVLYNGKKVYLNPIQEELATLYAKYYDTDYVKSKIFNKNFWNDWKEVLGPNHEIQTLINTDFSLINQYLLNQKEEKKKHKAVLKEEKELIEEKYKYALVDGVSQPVGNFRVEPPGIFIGRGCNPKLGMVKRRIYPEDITINIGHNVPIPPIPDFLKEHQWGSIMHDNTVEWLASWNDDITGKIKYVWLAAHSEQKSRNDLKKFELARKLKRRIKSIRAENFYNLSNPDIITRQIATALYFIDNFALRVGNEKGEDEADTVGVTSLRVEHILFSDDNKITLDFLGKDGIRYNKTAKVDNQVYDNMKEFTINKSLDNDIFDKITSMDINKYLQTFMKDLTAKVFRTYNASYLFQKELNKVTKKYESYNGDDKINILLDEFNKANAKVALLCNHQKNVNKSTNKQIENIDLRIKGYRNKLRKLRKSKKAKPETIKKIKDNIKKLKDKRDLKIELKNVSLGTSKINYIDPRITVAFMKKHNLPINKIFSKSLQDKFKWAMEADENFKF